MAACSSSDPEAAGPGPGHGPDGGGQGSDLPGKYEFEQAEFGPVDSVDFYVPEEIVAEEDYFAANRNYNSVRMTALDIDSPRYCGLHVVYDIPDEAWEQKIEDLQSRPLEDPGWHQDDSNWEPEFMPREEAVIRASNQLAGSPKGEGDWGEPDLANPAKGEWVSEEKTEKWVIGDCAASWDADETIESVNFTRIGYIGGRAADLAYAKVGVNNSGQLFVVDGTIQGWEQDMNGDWIPD